MPGLTSTGFASKTLATILDEQRLAFEGLIDPYVNLLPEEILGQIRDIMSSGIKNTWDLAEAVYGSQGLTASGVSLDIVGKLVGKSRLIATKGKIRSYKVTTDAAAVTIPAGTIFRSSQDSTREFETIEETYCATAGDYRVDLIATETGAFDISTDEVNVIVTPVSGLDAGTNDATAVYIPGTDLETDDEFRLRIFQTPTIARTLRVDAIRNAVLAINEDADDEGYTQVTDVKVIENTKSYTFNGMPRNTVQVVVYYPNQVSSPDSVTDSKICEAMAKSIADGIMSVATASNTYEETVTVGNSERVQTFSRADEIEPYITVNTSPALSGSEKTALENEISDFLDTFNVGQALRVKGENGLTSIINAFDSPGLEDYNIFIGLTSSPSGDDPIEVDDIEIIKYNASRVVIGDL